MPAILAVTCALAILFAVALVAVNVLRPTPRPLVTHEAGCPRRGCGSFLCPQCRLQWGECLRSTDPRFLRWCDACALVEQIELGEDSECPFGDEEPPDDDGGGLTSRRAA